MNNISNLFISALQETGLSLLHNWPYLLMGIFISALLKMYIKPEKASAFLRRFRSLGVVAATGLAVGTPFCSCGTMAVILGMLASSMPWAPIVAFMVASPLTSPEELLYSAGLFGWPFALAFFAASILLGLAGGALAGLLENRGWLANQTRLSSTTTPQPSACGCSETGPASSPAVLIPLASLQPVALCANSECGLTPVAVGAPVQAHSSAGRISKRLEKIRFGGEPKRFLQEAYTSTKQLLPMFVGFAFIGYLINSLIPAAWIAAVFGVGHIYSVPLAATLGLPLYINTEGSLPLIRSFLDNGMSQGAALAFLIAGSGTSIGAIAGALTIARWRVVSLVIGILWLGAIFSGYAYDYLIALKVF